MIHPPTIDLAASRSANPRALGKRSSGRRAGNLLEEATTRVILGAFYEVYNELGFGFLESVYQEALVRVLRGRDLRAEREVSLQVRFRGDVVGWIVKATRVVGDAFGAELKGGLDTTAARIESEDFDVDEGGGQRQWRALGERREVQGREQNFCGFGADREDANVFDAVFAIELGARCTNESDCEGSKGDGAHQNSPCMPMTGRMGKLGTGCCSRER